MPIIEGYRVRNYKVLQDVQLGKLIGDRDKKPLEKLVVVIGKNGSGKSSLFDSFGFLSDCLKYGVEEACDKNRRGGFEKIRSKGITEPIKYDIYYRQTTKSRPITYYLEIDLDKHKRPYVKTERLRQRRHGQTLGQPFSFLNIHEGAGEVWSGESVGEESGDKNEIRVDDLRKLAIAALGNLKEHPRISAFRKFLENWYLSYFTPDAARELPMAGAQKHLSIHGENLANVVSYLEREYPKKFQHILKSISSKIPGIDKIETKRSDDGRLLIKFNDRGFDDPFYASQMSDGTLKMFAYLVLLEDPDPPPFICIEEPENGLYHKLLEDLAQHFRDATKREGKPGIQVFVTTHQPHFVNAVSPEETWILEKGKDGFSKIKHASELPYIKELFEQEIPLGQLWYSDYLDED